MDKVVSDTATLIRDSGSGLDKGPGQGGSRRQCGRQAPENPLRGLPAHRGRDGQGQAGDEQQAVTMHALDPREGQLPYCGLTCLAIWLTMRGTWLKQRGQRLSCRPQPEGQGEAQGREGRQPRQHRPHPQALEPLLIPPGGGFPHRQAAPPSPPALQAGARPGPGAVGGSPAGGTGKGGGVLSLNSSMMSSREKSCSWPPSVP